MKRMLLTLLAAFGLTVPTLRAQDVWDGTTIDTSWYDSATADTTTSYEISTAAQLAGVAKLVNDGITTFEGKTITLKANVNLAGEEWTPIGMNNNKAFRGTFDGGGKTISNLTITVKNNNVGLFGYLLSPATIKGVTLKHVSISGNLCVGCIAGYAYTGTEIVDCHILGKIAVEGWWYIGGIAGNGYLDKVDNCTVVGEGDSFIKSLTGSYIGGIWGFRAEGKLFITNCRVENVAISAVDRVGGIAGIVHYGNTISQCTVRNVTILATLVDADPARSTCGLIAGANLGLTGQAPSKVLDCTVEATTAKEDSTAVTRWVGANDNKNTPCTNTIVGTNVIFDDKGKVTGGTFEALTENNLAEGMGMSDTPDGILVFKAIAAIGDTTYATLQAAIDAAQTGDTVTLLTDVVFDDFDAVYSAWATEWGEKYETEPEAAKAALVSALNNRLLTLDRDVTITLDLAGHTISSDVGYLPETLLNDPYPCGTLMLKQGNLTLKDSSTTGTGEIRGASMAVFQRGGTLTVQGGTYRLVGGESEWVDSYPIAALWTADGMCTIEGGTFHAGSACVSAETIPDLSPDSAAPSVTIKGGRFKGFPVGRVTVDAQVLASDEEGMLVSYRTFADFAQAHAETFDYDGETSLLRLKADYLPKGGFFVNGDVTIDLNGHKWTFPKDGQLFCNSGTVVTLQDSAGTGCLSQAAPSQESVIVTRGAFTLSSGTIGTADTATHGIIVAGNAALTINGGTIYGAFSAIAEASNNDGKCTITINGGTQIVQQWAGCPFLPDQSGASSTVTCTVTGGSYELKESPDEDRKKLKANLSKYCAADYVVLKNADGTYDVVQGEWAAEVAGEKYATLQEAVEAAEAATSDPLPTITLLRDVVLEDTVTLTKNLSIDLAGYTLYAPNPSTPAFTADSQVTVTLSKKEDDTVNGRLIAAGQKPEHNVTIDGVLPITKWTDDGAYDISWYEDGKTEYTLTTAAQVAGIAKKIGLIEAAALENEEEPDRFSTVTFTLGADIDLSALEWVSKAFDGVLDGNGHTIKGVRVSGTSTRGFFSTLGGTVKGIRFTDASISVAPSSSASSKQRYGGVVAAKLNGGTIANCVVEDSTITATGTATSEGLGALVGTGSGNIEDCLVSGVTFAGSATTGSFVGAGSATITNCYVDGALTQTTGTLMNVYAKNGDAFVRYNTVDDPNAPSGELGEAAALNGIGWLLNGQKTEGALTWHVDSNKDCKTLLPFVTATVATIPEVERYLTQDGTNYYANGHAATVKQDVVDGAVATVLQTQRDDYKVNETLTIAAPTTAVVYPGTQNGTVETATLTIEEGIQVCLDTVKSVTLKGTGAATLASASISAEQTVTLDGATLKVPGGVTLAVAGTVTVTNNGSFIGTDGTSSVDVTGSGSVTNLEEGLSVWNLAKKTWERAALVSADGTVYYPSVAAAIAANPLGGVRLLAPIADDAVKATSKETVTGTAAYDVADVLGGAFKVVGTSLVYDYDLGVGGLTIVKDAKGDLVVEVTVKLTEGDAAPSRTLAGCTLTVTSTLDGAVKPFPLVGTLTFTEGECKVTIPYTEENFPMGTNRLTVSISKGVGEGTP